MSSYEFIVSTGVIVANTENTLTEVQEEYKIAFNDTDLIVNSGPLFVLIEAETESRNAVANNNAQIANQINPNIAGGVFLDAIYSLLGASRNPGSRTTTIAVLSGVPGTIIPEGSAARSTEGDIYLSTGEATIGVGGTVNQQFAAEEIGEINLAIGNLNQIVDDILGWEGIDNPNASTIGSDVESDASARNNRNQLLALQSVSLSTAIFSNVRDVSGVNSLTFLENVTDTNQIIDGVLLVPHSIYVCVDGGTDSEIASALLSSKSGGCNWNGAVIVNTVDPVSGQTYVVQFDRPTIINIFIQITINPESNLSDPVELTKEGILAYAAGDINGYEGFVVGANVNPFNINNGVNDYNSSLNVSRVEIRPVGFPFSTDDIIIEVFQQADIQEADIQVIEL